MTDFKFNANQMVKVKLTERGEKILKEQHDSLNAHLRERGGKEFGLFELKTDSNGCYRIALWQLMETFGPHVGITEPNCFDLNMVFVDGESIEDVPESTEKQPITEVIQKLRSHKEKLHRLKKDVASLIISEEYEKAKVQIEELQNLERSIKVWERSEVLIDWSEW